MQLGNSITVNVYIHNIRSVMWETIAKEKPQKKPIINHTAIWLLKTDISNKYEYRAINKG
jgi:hypothetical protein